MVKVLVLSVQLMPSSSLQSQSVSGLAWANGFTGHHGIIYTSHANNQLDPPPQSVTLGLHPIARQLLLIFSPRKGGWVGLSTQAQGCLQMIWVSVKLQPFIDELDRPTPLTNYNIRNSQETASNLKPFTSFTHNILVKYIIQETVQMDKSTDMMQ